MKDTESETEDGITDKNINLQRPSNSRTIANLVETGQPTRGSRDSINVGKEKIEED